MKKLHFMSGVVIVCRPHDPAKLKYQLALKVSEITCKHCLKAIGLTRNTMQIRAKKVLLKVSMPNRKTVECVAEAFELNVVNDLHFGNGITTKDFVEREPEPICISVDLTESGFAALKEGIYGT